MKFGQKIKPTIVSIILVLFTNSTMAGWDDIDWSTCGPSGVSNRIKLAADKKSFWASQVVKLESIYESNIMFYGDWGMYCKTRSSSQDMINICLADIENQFNNITRCTNHAKRMCRLSGGFC